MNSDEAVIQTPITAEFVEPDVLAKELGMSKRTLDRWYVNREGPPRITIGRKILYRRESVLAWLRSREESQPRARKRSA
jgi:predicted DNA-binding transcriptional regulator AlpA